MEFSTGFLNKLLESAVKYYNADSDGSVKNKIPNKLSNIKLAIDNFSDALIYEANKTMKNEVVSKGVPILHAINLEGKNPGIISGKTEKDDKYTVHKKLQAKKDKTPEQIEKAMEKAQERLEIKKLKKEQKDLEKQELKDEKEDIKKTKKEVTEMKKDINKSAKTASTFQEKAQKENNEFQKKENPSQEDKNRMEELNNKANEYVNHYQNLLKQKEVKEKDINTRLTKIKDDSNKKKTDRQEKLAANKKIKEAKIIANKKISDEIKKEKEEDIAANIDENDMNIYDELFDLMLESQKIKEDDISGGSIVSLNNIKLYESPLPHQRHIEALEKSQPNDLLIPALLEGKEIKGDAYIKIFHGPPGTGKTYRLMQELIKIKDDKKHKKILVCAPSNIATMNMYYRAQQLGIKSSLVISNDKMPEDIKNNDIFNDKIIFSTISMRFGSKLNNVEFTTVLMDEAAQCMEAWVWGLMRQELKYIYLAGDQHQLPALVSEDGVNFNHGRSMMARLMSLGYPSELLNTQRRMHPDIVAFSNYKYYDNKLKTSYTKLKDGNENSPFEIINLPSIEERVGTSYINKEEAKKVVELYKNLKTTFNDVIVISPYQAQCNLLKELHKDMNIHTVDSFQGREADAVILTTVRTKNMGFWHDYRRLNVAMTRAKHVLRIVGNTNSWVSGPLKDLINFKNKI